MFTSFNNSSIRHKLFLLLGMMGAVLLVFVLLLGFFFSSLTTSMKELSSTQTNLQKTQTLYSNTIMEIFAVRTYFQTRNELQESRFKQASEENDVLLTELKNNSGDKAILDSLYEFETSYHQLREVEEKIIAQTKSQDKNVDKLFDQQYDATVQKVYTSVGKIVRQEEKTLTALIDSMNEDTTSASYALLILAVGATLYLLAVGFFIVSTIIKSISNLRNTVQDFAQGKFDKRAQVLSGDEIGELATNFNTMAESLSKYYRDLVTHAQKLGKKTENLTLSNEKIGEGWLQIQKEKARLTETLNSLWIGVAIIDDAGEIAFSNKALRQLLGVNSLSNVSDLQTVLSTTPEFSQKFLSAKQERKFTVLKPVVYGNKTFQVIFTPIALREGSKEMIGMTIAFEQLS
jgi:HAMP domain-containing protein